MTSLPLPAPDETGPVRTAPRDVPVRADFEPATPPAPRPRVVPAPASERPTAPAARRRTTTRSGGPGGPGGPRRPRTPRRPPSSGPLGPQQVAGRALGVVVTALVTAMVFNSHAMVHAGEGMPMGTTRTLVLAVGRPVDRTAAALSLDRPRRLLDRLFGHRAQVTGHSALTDPHAVADPRPVHPPAAHPAPAGVPLRRPTAADPLKLFVTGDSMTEFFGPALVNAADTRGRVAGQVDTRYGTGLVRPDFFDWQLNARHQMQVRHPEAVVVMMGGNDGQGITLPGGKVLRDGTQAWAQEYRRRAEVVMATLTAGGAKRVYWVGMPVARSAGLAADYALIDGALAQAAAASPGVRYVDVNGVLAPGGRYADYLHEGGSLVQVRTRDGIHVTGDGARLAAGVVLRALDTDWHLTTG